MQDVFGPELRPVGRTGVRSQGRRFIYFGGSDYFRLSKRPELLRALRGAASKFGLNIAASRRTTGNHPLYGELERSLSTFFGAPAAVLVSSGYSSNLAAAQGLAGEFSIALVDEKAHPSIRDAASWLGCEVRPFKHRNAEDAWKQLGRSQAAVLLTEGVFADGALAPLDAYRARFGEKVVLWVDDAHGGGVMGLNGGGTLEHLGLEFRNTIQTVTLSKAFGVYGGAILAHPATIRRIAERSSILGGNTPLPLPLVAAALKAVRLLSSNTLRKKLFANVRAFEKAAGIDVQHHTPVFAATPADAQTAARWRRALRRAGIYPTHINYFGGPPGGFFRFALSSEHSLEEINLLGATLKSLGIRFRE